MQVWPLLEIRSALADADLALADAGYYTQACMGDTEGNYPPAAAQFLANIATIRALLAEVVPPALAKAMADEQAAYDEEASLWEPSGS